MTLRTVVLQGGVRDGKMAGDEKIDGRVCSCCQTDAALAAAGPVIAYRDRSGEEVRDVSVIRRIAAGWSQPVRVHADNWKIPGCPVNGPAIAAAGRRVAVAWFTAAPPNPRVQAAFSEDGGATFGPAVVVDGDKPFGRVDLALDGNGDALVTWLAAGARRCRPPPPPDHPAREARNARHPGHHQFRPLQRLPSPGPTRRPPRPRLGGRGRAIEGPGGGGGSEGGAIGPPARALTPGPSPAPSLPTSPGEGRKAKSVVVPAVLVVPIFPR